MRIVTKAVVPACIAVLLVWASPLHAKVLNTTGTWKLNVEKSSSKEPAPKSGIVKIVHNEPAYKYTYTETGMDGKTWTMEWSGAFDGKPYKLTGPDGESMVAIKRIDDSTIQSTSTLPDGKTTATSTWVVSKDGKVATLTTISKGPHGEEKEVAVFEKQ